MRLRNSLLKSDLADELHVIQSPLCDCGSGEVEDAKHFFFRCTRYNAFRTVLVQDLLPLIIDEVDHLLYGVPDTDHLTNILVFDAVHKYIRNSRRFY